MIRVFLYDQGVNMCALPLKSALFTVADCPEECLQGRGSNKQAHTGSRCPHIYPIMRIVGHRVSMKLAEGVMGPPILKTTQSSHGNFHAAH